MRAKKGNEGMVRIHKMIIALIAGIPAVVIAPVAHADETVTYEVTSSDIAAANVEYFDISGRKAQEQVPLPWRINASVVNPHSDDAEVRADWRSSIAAPVWRPNHCRYGSASLSGHHPLRKHP